VFVVELKVLQHSFSCVHEELERRPSAARSTNKIIWRALQANIDRYNELMSHLEGLKSFFDICFHLHVIMSVLHISINCFGAVRMADEHLLMGILRAGTVVTFLLYELLIFCRLVDEMNENVRMENCRFYLQLKIRFFSF
jgi:hypothetical protein